MLKKLLYLLCLINYLHSDFLPDKLELKLKNEKDIDLFLKKLNNKNKIRISKDQKTGALYVEKIAEDNFFDKYNLFFFGYTLAIFSMTLESIIFNYFKHAFALKYINKLKQFYIKVYNSLSPEQKMEYNVLVEKKGKHLCIRYLNKHAFHKKNNIVWNEKDINLIWSLTEWDKDFFITISKHKTSDFPTTFFQIFKCSLFNTFYTLKKKATLIPQSYIILFLFFLLNV